MAEEEQENAVQEEKKEEKSVVEIAQELRDEIRAEKKALMEERAKLEKVKSENILDGRADAGEQVESKKGLSDKEYTDKIFSGEIPKED